MGTKGSTMLEPVWLRLPPIDAPGVSGSASCSLPTCFEAVQGARRFTGATLAQWELPDMFDEVALVVSELVTNALRYGHPASGQHDPLPSATHEQPFLLSLVHHGPAVLCAVFDPGRDVPEIKEPDFFQESGRGLHVLQSLAESWGWTTPDRHGKAVWALLQSVRENGPPVPPPGPADAEGEPLTRLLLLLELLSGPSWLQALDASARGSAPVEPG
jgi:anti-sigma regulatory factor (Ser/Thr protein kinase)